MIRTLALVSVLVVAAGCGGGRTSSPGSAPTTSGANHPMAPTSCKVYNRGTAEYVQVRSDGDDAASICRELTVRWSGSGAFWSVAKGSDSYTNDVRDCAMVRTGLELVVFDDKYGSMPDGNATCGALAARGWDQVG